MMNTKMNKTYDAVAIARAAYEAYVTKDRAAIENLIAEDFHFTSPLDNQIERATYFKFCWPNSEKIKRFDFINLVADGDRVFVTYEGHSTNGNVFRNTEIVTVRDGQLVEVEVYFGWSIPHKAEPGAHLSAIEDEFDKQQSIEETQIRRRIDDWANAFRSKDINAVMSALAPPIVSFDVVAPLAYIGREAYRKQWERLFASYQGPIEYEIRDLSITAEHDVAFSHSINRIRGTLKNGQKTDFWLRMTACWRRIDGQWLIEHEHVSVPVDLEGGKALLDLKP
jgi:uncharacterized protein (TIGR02246 family)